MLVKLLKPTDLLRNVNPGTWLDVSDAEAADLVRLGLAHTADGLLDRALLDTVSRFRHGPDPAAAEQRSFADFLRAVVRNDAYYLEKHYGSRRYPSQDHDPAAAPSTKAALAESSGSTGGYTVPIDFARDILARAGERSFLRPCATVVPVAAREVLLPLLDVTTAQSAGVSPFLGGVQMRWTPEAQTRTETEPQFKGLSLTPYELSGYATVSRPLLDDGLGGALNAYLTAVFGEAIAWFEEYAFLQGSGVGQPQGILGAPASLTVSRAQANKIQYADVTGLLAKLPPSSYDSAVWAHSPSAVPQLLQLSDGSNRAVYLQAGGAPETPRRRWSLLGLPAYCTEKLPALGTKGDLMLIDPRYYVIGDRGPAPGGALEVLASEHPSFLKNQVVIRIIKRCDGQPWVEKAITLQDAATQVSPFVVLQ
jgi:HK97 family phage major capsid protein